MSIGLRDGNLPRELLVAQLGPGVPAQSRVPQADEDPVWIFLPAFREGDAPLEVKHQAGVARIGPKAEILYQDWRCGFLDGFTCLARDEIDLGLGVLTQGRCVVGERG